MFSKDCTVPMGWFKSGEISVYDHQNSLDVQNIDRPDGSYDFIICSHVIEHVADPRRAIKELTRILSEEGLILLAYPLPVRCEKTRDWGYPDWSNHGHYRVFGRDFETEYATIIPQATVIGSRGIDSVTHDEDLVYFITKNSYWVQRILSSGEKTYVVSGQKQR